MEPNTDRIEPHLVNDRKTKELLIGSVIKDPPPPVSLNGTPVERVTTFKLPSVEGNLT